MAVTFEEVCERLKRIDEISLLEVLNLSSEDLVERFRDVIEERYELLAPEFDSEDSEDESPV